MSLISQIILTNFIIYLFVGDYICDYFIEYEGMDNIQDVWANITFWSIPFWIFYVIWF